MAINMGYTACSVKGYTGHGARNVLLDQTSLFAHVHPFFLAL